MAEGEVSDQVKTTPGAPQVTTPSDMATPQPQVVGDASSGKKTLWIVAGVVALILVLAGAGGYLYYLRNSAAAVPAPVAQAPKQDVKPLDLTVESPETSSLTNSDKAIVKGKTGANATVVVYNSVDESTVKADDSGSYQATVSLEKGINTLTVTAMDDNDQQMSKSVDVIYDDGQS